MFLERTTDRFASFRTYNSGTFRVSRGTELGKQRSSDARVFYGWPRNTPMTRKVLRFWSATEYHFLSHGISQVWHDGQDKDGEIFCKPSWFFVTDHGTIILLKADRGTDCRRATICFKLFQLRWSGLSTKRHSVTNIMVWGFSPWVENPRLSQELPLAQSLHNQYLSAAWNLWTICVFRGQRTDCSATRVNGYDPFHLIL